MAKTKELTLEELLHPKTARDPILAQIYHEKLPRKGWAGRLSKTEKEYVRIVKARRQQKPPLDAFSTRE